MTLNLTVARPAETSRLPRYVGEVVYLFAYDIAYDMRREPVASLLGVPSADFAVDRHKRGPQSAGFYSPAMVRLPSRRQMGPAGEVDVHYTIKLFPVGALSIAVHVPFAVEHIIELVGYHDLQLDGQPLRTLVRELAEQAKADLAPMLIRPVDPLQIGEAYTVFCVQSPWTDDGQPPFDAMAWLADHRRDVASLLTEEDDRTQLSDQEVAESTSISLSYYHGDLAVMDWDGALLIDQAANLPEVLHVLELANMQLAELAAYDRILDAALERAYRDLAGRRARRPRDTIRDLREMRVDLERLNDELSNTTKFFGDWHLARIYSFLAARFHLGDWHGVIADKQRTLDALYGILSQERLNRWMLVMEATIVVLFVIDLVVLIMGLK
ncbi:MAG: hypothetical protein BIFFINMI_02314 [Phycisphaerae bacterium]|nr:hypothetical protein [Phycisphaerae bacterium]